MAIKEVALAYAGECHWLAVPYHLINNQLHIWHYKHIYLTSFNVKCLKKI